MKTGGKGRWAYCGVTFGSLRWPKTVLKVIALVAIVIACTVFLDETIDVCLDFLNIKHLFVAPLIIGLLTLDGSSDEGARTLFHKQLGARIKMFREKRGIGQVELATACGYSSTGTISQIERGMSGMEISRLMKAADYLGVHPAALLTKLDLTDDQLERLSKFALLISHPDKAKNLEAILALLDMEKV